MYQVTHTYLTKYCMKQFVICQISSVKRPRSTTNGLLCSSAWSCLLIAREQKRWDINLKDRPVHSKSSKILLPRKVETQVQVRVTDSVVVLVYQPSLANRYSGQRGNTSWSQLGEMWYVHFTFHFIIFHWALKTAPGQGRYTHTVSPQGVFNFHTFQVNQTGDLPIMCHLTSVRCELQILIKVSWGI